MKVLLFILTIHELSRSVQSIGGVIWNKRIGDFVPIFSISAFDTMNQEILRKSRELEVHNFQGKVFRLTYFEEQNLVNSEANGTRISGAIGELWNILAEYLNITLKPILHHERTLGRPADSESRIYSDGLLRIIQLNETEIVPKMEAYTNRIHAAQLSLPFWKTRSRYYIRPEVQYTSTWMLKLFSRKVWYATLCTYLLLSVCSYASQKIFSHRKTKTSLNDHLFYNFGIICGQDHGTYNRSKSSEIVKLWSGVFSCLIRTAFGALLIAYVTQTTNSLPFHDLDSLLSETSYNVLTLSGTGADIQFQMSPRPEFKRATQMKRHLSVSTVEELYRKTCSTKMKYAMYLNEDLKKVAGMYICRLNPVGKATLVPLIVSGISWRLKEKKSIDIGILKLHEGGFIKVLRQRWIESKNVEQENRKNVEAINIAEIYAVICILVAGLLMAFVIFIFENLSFYFTNCK